VRKRFGAIIVVLLILVAVVAVAVSNLESYLNDNKAWITLQVEQALKRSVEFDAVGVSFSRGLAVQVDGFRIREDERYDEGDFLDVGEAEIRIAIWPALFGNIEVTKISFRDVSLTVIQTAMGMSTDSIGGTSGSGESPEASDEPGTEESDGDDGPSAAEAFTIALAEIRSGRVRYIDRTVDPPVEVTIEKLELRITDVGLDRPLDFELSGEILGGEDANLTVAGMLGPLPGTPAGSTPLNVHFTLNPIVVQQLRTLPGMADALDPNLPLSGTMNLEGKVAGSIENPEVELAFDGTDALLTYAEDGQKDRGVSLGLNFDVAMTGNDVEIKSADLEVDGVTMNVLGKVINLDDPVVDLVVKVFGGKILLDGGWSKEGRLDLDAAIEGLQLGEVAKAFAFESVNAMDGSLSMALNVTGTGTSWEELKPGLEGVGSAKIEAGVLHDINLVEEALRGLTGIPGLSDKLPVKISEKYPSLFSTGDTRFDTMEGRVEVREGRVHILKVEFDAKDYAMKGWGSVSLDGDLDMSTRLVLPEKLSDDLIDEAKLLKHLRDAEDRIELPISIRGQLPDISARPETDTIAKKLSSGASKKLVGKSKKLVGDSLGKLVKKKKKKKKKKKNDDSASAEEGYQTLENLLR